MLHEDELVLDSFERIFRVLDQEERNLRDIKSIYAERISQWGNALKAYTRIIEDISLPARLIAEHLLEVKNNAGLLAVEVDNITHSFSYINEVKVIEFVVIQITSGNLQLSWRDENYNYLLYPDKVELRTIDERSTIRLFFTQNFGKQTLRKFSAIVNDPKMLYIHPTLIKYLS